MTEGERVLWRLLRRKRLQGYRFRRQAPIGPYIADFFCPRARLIVELDGAPHDELGQQYRDKARTDWLEAHGCRVIRFWNVDVFKHPDEVLDVICRVLAKQNRRFAKLPLPSLRRIAPQGHLPPSRGKEGS